MTTGWLLADVTYDEATSDYEIAPAFNDDEDQSRWFYFKSNGKMVKAANADETKEKTINGKKYAFDVNGAMVAEWSLDKEKASDNIGTSNLPTTGKGNDALYSRAWRYFNSVEDGARVSKGWFKVVAAEYLNAGKYNDDEDAWYYADGSGNLYAGEFRTIKGKKYAFRNDGRMLSGLKFIKKGDDTLSVYADDDDYNFDTEDDFIKNAAGYYAEKGYDCYYFGGGEDGSMKTNKTNITIDGDNFNFYFEKSGSNKGAGVNGKKDKKYYLAGMLLKAGSDEKYQVIFENENGAYTKLADFDKFEEAAGSLYVKKDVSGDEGEIDFNGAATKKVKDLKEAYVLKTDDASQSAAAEYILVNTSGTVIDKKSKSKDGDDYVFVTDKNGVIQGVYVED